MHEQSIFIFTNFVLDHRYLGYAVLFFAMIIEGEILLIVAGLLARLEAFDIGDVFLISFIGVMVGDVLWYSLGVVTARSARFARLAHYAEKSVNTFLPNFRESPFRSIMLSKFIYGANHATLILSGVMKVKFRVFMRAETYASLVWVVVYMVAGYVFGHAALAVTHKALQFVLLAAAFVLGLVLIQRWAGTNYGRRKHKENKNSNA